MTSSGLQLKWQPVTCIASGSMSSSALTMVDFPDPFGPEIRTPPSLVSMALSMRAVLTFSCPTIAVKG